MVIFSEMKKEWLTLNKTIINKKIYNQISKIVK